MTQSDQTVSKRATAAELRRALQRLIGALDTQRFPNGSTYEPCAYSMNVTDCLRNARELLARGSKARSSPPDSRDVTPERRKKAAL